MEDGKLPGCKTNRPKSSLTCCRVYGQGSNISIKFSGVYPVRDAVSTIIAVKHSFCCSTTELFVPTAIMMLFEDEDACLACLLPS